MINTVRLEIEGKELVLETGKMAKQANGSVYATYGGSAVLATACCGSKPVEGLDYVPLQVEYNEKYYAAGKIPGGFLKREGRPKDKEILVCRLIDRPMRPLFHKSFGREIQVVPTVVSSDQINPPDVIAMIASFAAVSISDIPFEGPVGAVRVCYLDGKYVINPTFEQMKDSDLDIIVSGSEEGITMVEGGAKEVSEELMLGAIDKARVVIDSICKMQKELVAKCGLKKLPLTESTIVIENRDDIHADVYPKMEVACFVLGKFVRHAAIKSVITEAREKYCGDFTDDQKKLFDALMEEIEYTIVRKSILEKKVRTDGRGPEDIRKITCEIGILDRAHGSALFTRGETQSLGITTLGTVFDEQMVDDIDGDKRYNNFMLHYNFPPFSVGECGRMGTGRREIGHGHLAQRALAGVLPRKEDFPYTIRIVSEILESNGSSSMATVCSGTLSLLNAGVPIKKPVAGIAMGLITDKENTVVLSDILGEEDHLGDMDFKVCGTEEGITAFQMDIKISGVSSEIMTTALAQAKRGRMHILGIMNETISKPNETVSEFAPRIISLSIPEDKIGAVIGQGGKTIKTLSERFGVSINIEQDGTTTVSGKNSKAAEDALAAIKGLVEDPEIGSIYTGTVKRIVDFGAFVEFLPGKEGLCHISRLSRARINKVSEVLEMNQEIPVKIIEIDRMGRINLSYIDAKEDLEKKNT
ncbi:MAG: polyribonucleotide nucleotidyltransferase [Spirochaetales bacterium]|nr:polyribonucleotide nucleotidyltransferase [Spirochaetales bacterium]